MKKIYFRLFVFTQIGIALCLLLVVNTSNFINRLLEHILSLLLFPVNGASDSEPIFIMLACIFVSLFWAAIGSIIVFAVGKSLKSEFTKESWRVISYPQKTLICQLLLAILISVVFIITPYNPDDINLLLILTVVFAGSYFVAFIWHLSAIGKKSVSSWVALALASLLLLLIPAGAFYILNESEDNHKQSDDYTYREDIYEDDGDEYYEEEYIGEWEGPEQDDAFLNSCTYYIFDSLWYSSYFFEPIVKLGKPAFIEDYDFSIGIDKRLIFANNAALYINRDNNKLLQFYKRFGDFILKNISWQRYKEGGAYKYSNLLIRTHNECINDYGDLNLDLMNNLHNKLAGEWNYLEVEELLGNYNLTMRVDGEYSSDLLYAYGFWARRYHELNHSAAYSILCGINEHYNNISGGTDNE